jgi:hypothetical protein
MDDSPGQFAANRFAARILAVDRQTRHCLIALMLPDRLRIQDYPYKSWS